MQTGPQTISWRMDLRIRGGQRLLAAVALAAVLPATLRAQAYQSVAPDAAAKKLSGVAAQCVRNPASFSANRAQFEEYFTKYYFPNMTGTGPEELAGLGKARVDLFKDYLWKGSDQLQQVLTPLAFQAMGNILQPKTQDPRPFHPAVRYNAILIVGMLDEQYAREGATARPPKPYPKANSALTAVVKVANSGRDVFPPAVVLGAVIGLQRHAELRASLSPQAIQAMTDELVKLVSLDQPILDMDRDDYNWLRLRAAKVLATLGSPGKNNEVHAVLVKLTGQLRNMDDRCAVAALFSRIKYDGAKVDGAATADAMFALARDVGAEESKRAEEFNEKQIAGGGFSPGISDGSYLPDGVTLPEQFPRRRVLARLTDLRRGLQAIKPLVPAEIQPKIDTVVAAIDPVRQMAIDKEVELKLTEAIIKMAAAINHAVPAAQPAATTAASTEF